MKDSVTNTLYFSNNLLYDEKYNSIKKALDERGISYSGIPYTRDIWCRDYMPIQIGDNKFVTYNYKPDYLVRVKDFKKYITSISDLKKWSYLNDKEIVHCDIILDGGNVVVCGDKVILTEKVFKENLLEPYKITKSIERAFDKQVIWIPCDPHEITESMLFGDLPLCHADGMIHAIDDETILLANYKDYDLQFRKELLTRLSPYFNIKEFCFGGARTENSWIYINYVQVQDIVLVPTLGGKDEVVDNMAIEQLKLFLGTDKVFGIDSNTLTFSEENGGGSLHCVSWNIYERNKDINI